MLKSISYFRSRTRFLISIPKHPPSLRKKSSVLLIQVPNHETTPISSLLISYIQPPGKAIRISCQILIKSFLTGLATSSLALSPVNMGTRIIL